VYNLGVSGYGTDQENLVLHRFFDRIRPRVVFLVICGDNDNDDNASNCRGGYYKPWYTIEAGKLSLHGVPVPKSEQVIFAEHKLLCSSYVTRLLVRAYCKWRLPAPSRTAEPPTGAILLDMQAFLTSHGAAFEVGLQHPHPEMETFLARYQIPFVILETTNAGDLYQEHGNHWTPQGHTSVAAKIDGFLRN
jgi:hypothetical protein